MDCPIYMISEFDKAMGEFDKITEEYAKSETRVKLQIMKSYLIFRIKNKIKPDDIRNLMRTLYHEDFMS